MQNEDHYCLELAIDHNLSEEHVEKESSSSENEESKSSQDELSTNIIASLGGKCIM